MLRWTQCAPKGFKALQHSCGWHHLKGLSMDAQQFGPRPVFQGLEVNADIQKKVTARVFRNSTLSETYDMTFDAKPLTLAKPLS